MVYTHGLDKMYAFETIDPNSVRKLSSSEDTKKSISSDTSAKELPPPALELFPSPTRLFLEEEALDSLRLSPFALQAMKGFSLETVGALHKVLQEEPARLRSIGQGHLDEIEIKIDQFLKKNTHDASFVDLSSAVRLVLKKLSPQERSHVASLFCLKSHCFCTVGEEKNSELFIKRLQGKEKEQFLSSLQPRLSQGLGQMITLLQTSFITPFIHERGGIVSMPTLELALFEASKQPYDEWKKIQSFFQTIVSLKGQNLPWFASQSSCIDIRFVAASSALALSGKELLEYAQKLLSLSKRPPRAKDLALQLWKTKAKQWDIFPLSLLEELVYWSFCPFTQIGCHA